MIKFCFIIAMHQSEIWSSENFFVVIADRMSNRHLFSQELVSLIYFYFTSAVTLA